MWQHNYEPLAGSLGVSAIAAVVPIVVLFLMLGVLRKPAWMSAMAALASALLVSLIVYQMPVSLVLISTLYGAAFVIFPIAWPITARQNGSTKSDLTGWARNCPSLPVTPSGTPMSRARS